MIRSFTDPQGRAALQQHLHIRDADDDAMWEVSYTLHDWYETLFIRVEIGLSDHWYAEGQEEKIAPRNWVLV